jgi:hypothetical protein
VRANLPAYGSRDDQTPCIKNPAECGHNLKVLTMSKLPALFVAATVALFTSGMTPLLASSAEAKTATQMKQESRAKATIARNNAVTSFAVTFAVTPRLVSSWGCPAVGVTFF